MDPAARDRFVDLLRGGSIVAVVVGHWLVADVRWSGGQLTETSTLAEVPLMWPVTWVFLVIPLFFFVGGYANRRSWDGTVRRGEGYAAFLDRRTHRMLAPTALYLLVVAVVGWLLDSAGGVGVAELGGLLYQPLWFLGAYLWVVALVPVTLAAHRRYGAAVLAALLALVVLGDVGRYALGVELAGYLNVLWVWLLMHQLGYWYGDSAIPRRAAALMALGGLAVAGLLVATPTYPGTMVGITGVSVGNMHPPNLAVTALGVGQIGVCLLLRPVLVRWLRRPRVWAAVIAINLTVITIYLWHQAALIVAARVVLPLGLLPDPAPGSLAWWLVRLAWLLVPGAVLAGIVAAVGRAEQVHPPRPSIPAGRATAGVAALAVVLVGVAFVDLAGSSALGLFRAGQQLGPFTATPVLGFVLLALGAGLFPLMRHRGRRAEGAESGGRRAGSVS
jgi:hypothetical protein